MLRWRVGDVAITKIVEFEGTFPGGGEGSMVPQAFPEAIKRIKWLVPHFANEDGHMKASVHAVLVETPSRRFVVDTCVGNDKPRSNPFFNMLKTSFLADLAAAGWSRDKVDGVLCTHLHVDHVGWNTMLENGRWVPTFSKAKYYIGRKEWEHWSKSDEGDQKTVVGDSVKPILDAGLAQLVEMDAQLAPEIRLKPTPGHTPGHVSVVIESKGERAVITGDIMHHPCQVAHPEWSSGFDSDQNASRKTRQSFLAEYAGTPTLVIGTHFAGATAGRVVKDGDGYRLLLD